MRRQESKGKLALLYLDLDGFKEINDSTGHVVGDLLLQRVAERLRSVLQHGDEFCRLGGNEVAIVLTRQESLAETGSVAESLIDSLRQSFQICGQELRASASVEISVYPTQASDYTSLLQQADSACTSRSAPAETERRFTRRRSARLYANGARSSLN